jgi:N-hydroxyarylamine O-acetyltransferase
LQNGENPSSILRQWRAWRQRLRGDPDEMLAVFEKLSHPKGPPGRALDQRLRRAAAFCDAALFKLWLAGIAPPEAGRHLNLDRGSLLSLSPATVTNFALSLYPDGLIKDEEFLDGTGDEAKVISRADFDECWHTADDFRHDLMRYLFRPEVYLERVIQVQEDIRDLMAATDDLNEFVTGATALELRSAADDPLVALGSLIAASLPRDDRVRRLIKKIDDRTRRLWTMLYSDALTRYGRRLNDGQKVDDFTRLAAMLTEGSLAHSRSYPQDVTSEDMRAGIQLLVRAFVSQTEAAATGSSASALDRRTFGRYRRHLVLNEELTADLPTLRRLQGAHLDGFAYCNLGLMLEDVSYDLSDWTNRLLDLGHGGLCYQLNYPLALMLRVVGFDVAYLWGTVGKERGVPGEPAGNHLGLLVTLDGENWLVDAGLGDGPREPVRLVREPDPSHTQGGFVYEVEEDSEADTWTLVHDPRGSFAEVVFARVPVEMTAFREPGRIQATTPGNGWVRALCAMRRTENQAHILRGRVYEVTGEQSSPRRIVGSQEEWSELLASKFGIYLGNVSRAQLDRIWAR